jgi:hypothetical protein
MQLSASRTVPNGDYLKAIPLQRFSQHIADGFVVLLQ